jgi:hypothetical protein
MVKLFSIFVKLLMGLMGCTAPTTPTTDFTPLPTLRHDLRYATPSFMPLPMLVLA